MRGVSLSILYNLLYVSCKRTYSPLLVLPMEIVASAYIGLETTYYKEYTSLKNATFNNSICSKKLRSEINGEKDN